MSIDEPGPRPENVRGSPMPEPNHPQDSKPIADAASLFDTDEVRPFSAPPVASTSAGTAKASDGYELEADPFPDVDELPRPVALPEPVERPRSRPEPAPKAQPEPQPKRAPEPVSELTG